MINRTIIGGAYTSEVHAICVAIITCCENANIQDDVFLAEKLNLIKNFVQELSTAINRAKFTSKVEKANDKMILMLRGLYYYLRGLSFNPIEGTEESSKALLKIVTRNGGLTISRLPSLQRSSSIMSLLDELSSDGAKPHITAVQGVETLISNLQKAHNECIDCFVDYESTKEEEKQLKTASDLKDEICNLINKTLTTYLYGQSVSQPEKYQSLAGKISELIEENNSKIRARRKKSKKAKDNSTKPGVDENK